MLLGTISSGLNADVAKEELVNASKAEAKTEAMSLIQNIT